MNLPLLLALLLLISCSPAVKKEQRPAVVTDPYHDISDSILHVALDPALQERKNDTSYYAATSFAGDTIGFYVRYIGRIAASSQKASMALVQVRAYFASTFCPHANNQLWFIVDNKRYGRYVGMDFLKFAMKGDSLVFTSTEKEGRTSAVAVSFRDSIPSLLLVNGDLYSFDKE
ncbi:hypothetical protein ACE38W_06135 [Chitinophaga sp. Hz27]|uniref:hypothetical protein n=1 Tax=Chitinophaga sp. Hz27 TaxID=3347169 RepID=UPI0035DACCC2